MRRASAAIALRSSVKSRRSISTIFSCASSTLRFVLLQLGRGEALGVDQRLLAFVVGGREMQVGLRDLEVVAEDVVELHLQRADAGALALALLDLRDVLLAVAAEVAQLVERRHRRRCE